MMEIFLLQFESRRFKFKFFHHFIYFFRDRLLDYLFKFVIVIKSSVMGCYLIAEKMHSLLAVNTFGQEGTYVCMGFTITCVF